MKPKSLLFRTLLTMMIAACSHGAHAQSLNQEPTRLIVKYKDAVTNQNSRLVEQLLSLSAGEQLSFRRSMALKRFQVFRARRALRGQALQRAIQRLKNNPNVESVEVDALMQHTFDPNDTYYSGYQWHYYDNNVGINADQAWDTHTGHGTVVAVLDTGITNHSDLDGNMIAGYDFISDTFVSRDGDGRDNDPSDPGDWNSSSSCESSNSSWHGTHVAGTVAALTNNNRGVAGVAHDGRVLVVRVLGRCGGYLSDIADAIVWSSGGSVAGVPGNPNPADVINMSLGGGGSCGSTYQNAINQAVANGATVVVAAGNSNANANNFRPANCQNVITVAANDQNGNKSSFSNYGSVVDVTAPGSRIASTLNRGSQAAGSESYALYSGTSMATPHVAGIAALLYEADPGITPGEVESILKDTARPFPGSCSGGCGSGIVDARAALDAVDSTPPSNEAPNAGFNVTTNDLVASFTDTSTDDGSIDSWSWDFGDGGSSSQQNPTHSYAVAGSYTVTLTVTDDQGETGNVSQQVTLTAPAANNPPSASFSVNVSELTANFTDSSSDADGNVVSWSWDFGDGATSTDQNPSHSYASGGNYNVTLTVTDDDGATAQSSQSVTATEPATNNPPSADFSYSVDELSASFSDNSSDPDGNSSIASRSWSFGDGGTSSQTNPSHAYASAGTYNVTLTVTDDEGDSDSITKSVTVTAPPPAEISLSASASRVWYWRRVNLSWSGASGGSVDIYRNGSRITTTSNDGSYSQYASGSGTLTYQVCEQDSSNCSNTAVVQ